MHPVDNCLEGYRRSVFLSTLTKCHGILEASKDIQQNRIVGCLLEVCHAKVIQVMAGCKFIL